MLRTRNGRCLPAPRRLLSRSCAAPGIPRAVANDDAQAAIVHPCHLSPLLRLGDPAADLLRGHGPRVQRLRERVRVRCGQVRVRADTQAVELLHDAWTDACDVLQLRLLGPSGGRLSLCRSTCSFRLPVGGLNRSLEAGHPGEERLDPVFRHVDRVLIALVGTMTHAILKANHIRYSGDTARQGARCAPKSREGRR